MVVKVYLETKYVYLENNDWLAHVSRYKLYGYRDLIGKLMLKGE